MKTTFSIIMVTAGLLAAAVGQSASSPSVSSKTTPPTGPLVQKRAPEKSQWTETTRELTGGINSDSRNNAVTTTERSSAPAKPKLQKLINKVNSDYHIKIIEATGDTIEKWLLNGVQLSLYKNAALPLISTQEDQDVHFFNATSRDFHGFEWIATSNFTDTKNVNGVECLCFKTQTPDPIATVLEPAEGTVTPPTRMVDVEALIDAKTRLPVSLQTDTDIITYEFKAGEVDLPKPPAHAMNFMEARTKRLQQAKLVPPP